MQEPSIIVNIPETNSKNYPIYINNDKISNLKKELDNITQNQKRLIVISEKVYKLYNKELNFDKKELFILKDRIYKPETREENFEIQRKISSIIKRLNGKEVE